MHDQKADVAMWLRLLIQELGAPKGLCSAIVGLCQARVEQALCQVNAIDGLNLCYHAAPELVGDDVVENKGLSVVDGPQ